MTVGIQETASSGVEGCIVFHVDHGRLDSIQRRAAAFQNGPTGCQGLADAVDVCVDRVVGDGPGAAVDNQYWIAHNPGLLVAVGTMA